MFVHQGGEVGHVLVGLLQQVGQALVFLLIDEFSVAFLIFSLRGERGGGGDGGVNGGTAPSSLTESEFNIKFVEIPSRWSCSPDIVLTVTSTFDL